jgi:hypothetical protein
LTLASMSGSLMDMATVLLTRNLALDHGRVVDCSCRWARRSQREMA